MRILTCFLPDKTSRLDPRGVAVDRLGHVLVADGNARCVSLLSARGEFLQRLVTSREGLGIPAAISVDLRDQLVIADAATEEIKIFSYLG